MSEHKPSRYALRDDGLKAFDNVRVVVEERATEARVFLSHPVWGMPNATQTFLGSNPGIAARRYAEALLEELIKRAEAQHDYQAKKRLRNAVFKDYRRAVDRDGQSC